MGIPHLITYLRPFATTVDLAGQSLVIDGPGLAYHVWHICLASQKCFRNPFEATPSYKLLGETVINYLDQLQDNGVCVRKIYFDGFLPVSKQETRCARLMSYAKQLNDYYQSWPHVIPSMCANPASFQPPTKLFGIWAVPSSFTKLPAAPFLVPAIIESLSISERYQSIIEVVPGEADLFCANDVRKHGGTVLTSDSDLLVHDLGTGSVSFFKDIELINSGTNSSLRCVQYQLVSISERLGLPKPHGIRALAFEMSMDRHGAFRALLQKAAVLYSASLHESMYLEFSAEYTAQALGGQGDGHSQLSLHQHLQLLDPRISEYVLQFRFLSQVATTPEPLLYSAPSDGNRANIFLPFLLDCRSRTNAWEMSNSIRQLGYGFINIILPEEQQVTSIIEYRRLQNGSGGREYRLPTVHEVQGACTNLLDLFKQLRNTLPDMSKEHLWRAVAIYQDQLLASANSKPALSTILVNQSKSGQHPPVWLTWEGIHFFAQLQGSYYSFRILNQILGFVLAYKHSKILPSVFESLHLELRTLPALRELPAPIEGIPKFGCPEDQEILAAVRKFLNLEDEDTSVASSSARKGKIKKSKKKKHNSNPTLQDNKGAHRLATNRFEMLNQE